jgi:hypothetical protein
LRKVRRGGEFGRAYFWVTGVRFYGGNGEIVRIGTKRLGNIASLKFKYDHFNSIEFGS